jgi:hypothetical protein
LEIRDLRWKWVEEILIPYQITYHFDGA